MSRHIQVTFDAHDPRTRSSFWRDVLGYVHPGPPGVELPEDADPLAAWDEFLARVGVPEGQRNTRSAIEDPDGHGPRLFFQQVPEDKKVAKNRVHLDVRAAPGLQGQERMAALEAECERLVAWERRGYVATSPLPGERRLHRDDRPRGQRVLPGLTTKRAAVQWADRATQRRTGRLILFVRTRTAEGSCVRTARGGGSLIDVRGN